MRLGALAAVCVAGGFLLAHAFGHAGKTTITGALAEPRSPYSQQPVLVDVFEYGFSPRRVVVVAGQAVAWKDVGKQFHIVIHTTREGRALWAAAKIAGSATHVFTQQRTYRLRSALPHPQRV